MHIFSHILCFSVYKLQFSKHVSQILLWSFLLTWISIFGFLDRIIKWFRHSNTWGPPSLRPPFSLKTATICLVMITNKHHQIVPSCFCKEMQRFRTKKCHVHTICHHYIFPVESKSEFTMRYQVTTVSVIWYITFLCNIFLLTFKMVALLLWR